MKTTVSQKKLLEYLDACENGNVEILDSFVTGTKGTCFHWMNDEGLTGLDIAVKSNNGRSAELLIDYGAVAAPHKVTKNSALHVACFYGYLDLIQLLIDRFGIDQIYYPNAFQETPLYFASMNGQKKAIEKLFALEDSNNLNNESPRYQILGGKSCVDVATHVGHINCYKILKIKMKEAELQ